jgi:hypothetical protein
MVTITGARGSVAEACGWVGQAGLVPALDTVVITSGGTVGG